MYEKLNLKNDKVKNITSFCISVPVKLYLLAPAPATGTGTGASPAHL
jgi:hypothetical protein